MRRIAVVFERSLLPLVVLFAAIGLTWVAPARGAVRHHGISVALAVLVGAVGLGLRMSALRELGRHWRRLSIAVVIPLVTLPALAWLASRIVTPGPLRMGVLATGAAPSEVASVALAALAGGSAALAAGVLMVSTVTCVLLAGPVLHVAAGSGARFSSGTLLVSLVEIVAIPLLAGALIRTRLPERRQGDLDAFVSLSASVAVLLLIWLVASQAHLGVAYLRTGLALLVFLVGSTAVGVLLTVGLARPERVSLLLPIAMRDFAIAAGIATHAFGSTAAAPLGLYGVLVLILGAATSRVGPRTREGEHDTQTLSAGCRGGRAQRASGSRSARFVLRPDANLPAHLSRTSASPRVLLDLPGLPDRVVQQHVAGSGIGPPPADGRA